MKNMYLLLALALLTFSISAAAFLHTHAPNHSISFIYKVTSEEIITEVSYNPGYAPFVEKYIDSCLQPAIVFGDKHKTNKDIQISNRQLNYHIKGSPGSLTMTALKTNNSASSLSELKTIWEGLKSVVKPD